MRILVSIAAVIVIIANTVYLVRAFDSRGQRALDLEHRVTASAEFSADRDKSFAWSDYLALEEATSKELQGKLLQRSQSATELNRHAQASRANPDNHDSNRNRSNNLVPEQCWEALFYCMA